MYYHWQILGGGGKGEAALLGVEASPCLPSRLIEPCVHVHVLIKSNEHYEVAPSGLYLYHFIAVNKNLDHIPIFFSM